MKKNLLLITATLFIAAGSLTITSCGSSNDKPKNETTPNTNDSTKVSAYVCPMGPQCGKGDAPGKCPACGAEMVKNEKGLK